MSKQEALELIDSHKNGLLNPAEMLSWVWLRVIILQIPEDNWNQYLEAAIPTLSA